MFNISKRKNLINLTLFLIISIIIINTLSNIYKYTDLNRYNLLQLKYEENLDVINIGGSATFEYWQPLTAWKEAGITSYNFSTGMLPVYAVKPYLEYCMSIQDTNNYVIDLRSFIHLDNSQKSDRLHYAYDLFPNTKYKYEVLKQYIKYDLLQPLEDDPKGLPLKFHIFDLISYHGQDNILNSEIHWQFIKNDPGPSIYKGYQTSARQNNVKFTNNDTEETIELMEKEETELRDILEILKNNNKNAIFVLTPFPDMNKEHQMRYNEIYKIVNEYGFTCMNTNEHLDEIGLIPEQDFFDGHHVNILGAEKYTKYFTNVLKEEFNLSNEIHKDQKSLIENWNKNSEIFEKDLDVNKKAVLKIIKDKTE